MTVVDIISSSPLHIYHQARLSSKEEESQTNEFQRERETELSCQKVLLNRRLGLVVGEITFFERWKLNFLLTS